MIGRARVIGPARVIARARALLGCGLALALSGLPVRVLAQTRADGAAAGDSARANRRTALRRVQLRLPECEAESWMHAHQTEIVRALALELQSDGHAELGVSADDAEPDGAQLELLGDCADRQGDTLTLRARASPDATPHSRALDLRDVPAPLRPRALALALAELLRASVAVPAALPAAAPLPATSRGAASETPPPARKPEEARAAPATSGARATDSARDPSAATVADGAAASEDATRRPAQRSSPAPAAPPERDAARARPAAEPIEAAAPLPPDRRHALWLAADVRWLPRSSDGLYGGALGWQWRWLGASLHALFGRSSDSLGSAHFGLAHAVLSYEPLQLRWTQQRLHAGAALGLGGTWASAASSGSADGGSALMLTYQLGLQLGLAHALSRELDADLVLAGGYARGPRLRADQRELATLSGAFLGAALRVALGVGAR